MKITDNFHFIIEKIDRSDLNDLYAATYHVKKQGSFECFQNHVTGCYYVKCNYLYDTLLLQDNETKISFLESVLKKIPTVATPKAFYNPLT